MKKHSVLTIICLIFFATSLFSQGSGYMGKHFVINAEVINSPCYFVKNHNGNKGYFAFDYILNPSIEYILGKGNTVGASFMYEKSKYDILGEEIWVDYDDGEYGYGEYERTPASVNSYSSIGGGLFYKKYFGKNKSVFGNYMRIEVDFLSVKTKDEQSLEELRTLMGGFRFELGKDFLFFNCLKLNVGIGLGLLFGGHLYYSDIIESSFSDHLSGASAKTLKNYFFGLRMGVGFLAF